MMVFYNKVAMIKATVKLTMAYKRKQLAELKDEDVGKLLESFAKVHLDKIYPSRRTRLYVTTLGYKIINFITKTITIHITFVINSI